MQGVARELHIAEDSAELHDERVGGVLERFLAMLSVPGDLAWVAPSSDNELATIDENIYHHMTCKVIEAAARRNQVVIVGHGASFALAGWPGVMHIGLYAPLERRVETVMLRLQVNRVHALRRVTDSDHGRARYIKRFYQANWHDADHYHLIIDTAMFAPDGGVDLFVLAWLFSNFGAGRDASGATAAAGPV